MSTMTQQREQPRTARDAARDIARDHSITLHYIAISTTLILLLMLAETLGLV